MEENSSENQHTPSDENVEHRFEFRGDGLEYFKIWIVNILLTIVTLGIYSAWATVRNNRYFYSNLYLNNKNFRYLAEPLTILKGRIIAVLAFIAYSVAAQFMPTLALIFALLLFVAIPFFINQSLAFKHRMSAYQNIQFRFHGNYGEAFMVFYVWPLLGVLTLGILYPLAMKKLHEYMVRNSAYGTTHFSYEADLWDYGKLFLVILGVGLIGFAVTAAITYLAPATAAITPALMVFIYFGVIVYFMVKINNLYFCSTGLAQHRFGAQLTIPGMASVLLINTFLTIVTLGLYLPAAKVRMAKYMADNISLHASGSLDNFAAAEQENVSVLGEEFGQVFDFGI